MRAIHRIQITKLLLWAAVLAALIVLFRRMTPPAAAAGADEQTAVVLLTEEGPAQLTMAEYLPHALAAEMPLDYGPEALKAQAVAIRSYVLAGPRHDNADICGDSACCLAYWPEDELRARWGDGYAENLARAEAAAAATDGQVLSYGGAVAETVFHASSAGATEDSAAVWTPEPYLVSVWSPETAETVPDLVTEARFSPEALAEALGLDGGGDPADWLAGVRYDDAGRVALLSVAGQALSGGFVRSALGLRSTAFTAEYDGTDFVFTAAGNGHGVGMSQTGAGLMAADGAGYAEILAHYYPGTELISIDEISH